MELWDAYKADETKAGFDLIRGEKIPADIYHIVAEVVVQHTDGDYLLMQRAFNKESYPGLWEIGAGGSVLKGETPHAGAIRELQEETGIMANELEPIYHIITPARNTIYYGYLVKVAWPKEQITFQDGETIAYQWITLSQLLAFYDSDSCIATKKRRLKGFIDQLRCACIE